MTLFALLPKRNAKSNTALNRANSLLNLRPCLPASITYHHPLFSPWTFPTLCLPAALFIGLFNVLWEVCVEVELRWSPLSGSLVLWEVYIHHTGFSRHMQTLAGNSVGHTHLPFFSRQNWN